MTPTRRERQVLDEMTRPGATCHSVARRLGIAEPTVRRHLANLYNRLGVNSVGQAYRALTEAGG